MKLTEKQLINFFKKIEKTDYCWLWIGSSKRTKMGYGSFSIKNEEKRIVVSAHRVSYYIHKGDFNNLNVLHTCDNPKCVNPDHLFLGTHLDNMKDCTKKGRHKNLNADYERNQTHCLRGHELIKENLYNLKTRRHSCKECNKIRYKKYYIKKDKIIKTHCSRGHEFTIENLVNTKNKNIRRCKICERIGYERRKNVLSL